MSALPTISTEDSGRARRGLSRSRVRASRELRPDIDALEVGPFRYQVIEPLKKVRFSLDPNEYGLRFEIEGVSPLYEEPAQTQISRGRLKEDIERMVQRSTFSSSPLATSPSPGTQRCHVLEVAQLLRGAV